MPQHWQRQWNLFHAFFFSIHATTLTYSPLSICSFKISTFQFNEPHLPSLKNVGLNTLIAYSQNKNICFNMRGLSVRFLSYFQSFFLHDPNSAFLSICLSEYLSSCRLSSCLFSVFLPACISSLSSPMFFCPSVCLPACPPVCLFVCLFSY